MIQTLIKRADRKFIPTELDDFIGNNVVTCKDGTRTGARTIAKQINQAVKSANEHGRQALTVIINGAPGTGKSALAKYAQFLTGCNKWNTTKCNGTECKVEKIDEIAASLLTTSLFGDWRMLWIDEADFIPRVAQARFLTVLDDLPDGVIVILTSNCRLTDFEDRFHSRFQAFEIAGPDDKEVASFLLRLAPELGQAANQIATFAGGNVRQALLDAQGILQQAA
jgi:replication-associated recombination protein RarA